MEAFDAPRPDHGGMPRSVSNIFRMKSRKLSTQGSMLGRSMLGSGLYDAPDHWAITVPDRPSEGEPADQNSCIEMASGGGGPSAASTPFQAHTSETPTDSTLNPALSIQGTSEASDPPQSAVPAASSTSSPENVKAALQAGAPQAGTEKPESCIFWQPVGVDIYSLGSFAFKGMNKHQHIAQVVPSALASRLELFSHVVKRGKATCIKQDDRHIQSVTMWLPDLTGLKMAC